MFKDSRLSGKVGNFIVIVSVGVLIHLMLLLLTPNVIKADISIDKSQFSDRITATNVATKTVWLTEAATLLPTPPVNISISKFVLGEIQFNQSFVSINRLCFHFQFSYDDPFDPNEFVSFIGAPGLDGAGFINGYSYPLYFRSRCFSSEDTTDLFIDGHEYFGVRMDPGFGSNPDGTVIIEAIDVEVEGVVKVYEVYLPFVIK